jgi:hypothetical protein
MFNPVLTVLLGFFGMAFTLVSSFVVVFILGPSSMELKGLIIMAGADLAVMLLISWMHACMTEGPKAVKAGWITGIIWAGLTVLIASPYFYFLLTDPSAIMGDSHEVDFTAFESLARHSAVLWNLLSGSVAVVALLFGPPLFAKLLKNKRKSTPPETNAESEKPIVADSNFES